MSKELEIHSSDRKILFILNILSLLIFLFMLYCVMGNHYFLSIDRWVSTHVVSIQRPVLTEVVIAITNFNGLVANVVFTIFAMLFLTYKTWYKDRLFYLLSFSGAVVLFLSIKQMVAHPRPYSSLIDVINYSFPSGHSTLTMTTALLVYFIFVKRFSSSLAKNILLVVCIVWPMFIAFTRVYLNVHWLSDVIAGLALGIFWVTLMGLFLLKVK